MRGVLVHKSSELHYSEGHFSLVFLKGARLAGSVSLATPPPLTVILLLSWLPSLSSPVLLCFATSPWHPSALLFPRQSSHLLPACAPMLGAAAAPQAACSSGSEPWQPAPHPWKGHTAAAVRKWHPAHPGRHTGVWQLPAHMF